LDTCYALAILLGCRLLTPFPLATSSPTVNLARAQTHTISLSLSLSLSLSHTHTHTHTHTHLVRNHSHELTGHATNPVVGPQIPAPPKKKKRPGPEQRGSSSICGDRCCWFLYLPRSQLRKRRFSSRPHRPCSKAPREHEDKAYDIFFIFLFF
jgi:hypothetical protein